MAEESINIQEILNVYQTLQKHGRTELIDLSFIQEFRNKLSYANRKWLTDSRVRTCNEFIDALYSILATNDELGITGSGPEKKGFHNNTGNTIKDLNRTRKQCILCNGDHASFLCEKLAKKMNAKKKTELGNSKQRS